MTKSEYQELVEFLGVKFGKIDQRFDRVDERLDRVEGRLDRLEGRADAAEEGIRHNGVLIDRNHESIRKLAEAFTMLGQRLGW